MTISKGVVVLNTELRVNGIAPLPAGTVFYCSKGGANPSVSFYSTERSAVLTIKPTTAIHGRFVTAPNAELHPKLAEFFSLGKDAITTKKGDMFRLTEPLKLETFELPKGHLVECTRGGARPEFRVLHDGETYVVSMSAAGLKRLEPASPVSDHPQIEALTVKITTYEGMSEETLALRGTIKLGSDTVEVVCHGHGDGVAALPLNAGAVRAVNNAIIHALQADGYKADESKEYIEDFVNFATSSKGHERFSEYLTQFDALVASWRAERPSTKPAPGPR